MKKTFKRIVAFLIASMCFLSMIPVSAASTDQVYHLENVTVTITDEAPPMTRAIVHLEEHHTGAADYDAFFTCDPNEGNRLNIWVDNTNGNYDVIVNLTVDGERIPFYIMPAGEDGTTKIESNDGEGLASDISINITSSEGRNMDFWCRARQFWQY